MEKKIKKNKRENLFRLILNKLNLFNSKKTKKEKEQHQKEPLKNEKKVSDNQGKIIIHIVLIALFFVSVYISFLIIKPFINAILFGLVLTLLGLPAYRFILKYVKIKSIASLLTVILVFSVAIVPLVLITNLLIYQITTAYHEIIHLVTNINSICDNSKTFLCLKLNQLHLTETSDLYVDYFLSKLNSLTTSLVSKGIRFVPSLLINAFISIFIMYYLLIDFDRLSKVVYSITPLKETHKKKLFTRIKGIYDSTIYGQILTAFTQSILAGIVFLILGIKSYIILSIILFFFALIPMIGPTIVWLPVALMLIIRSIEFSNNLMLWKGVFLLIFGSLVINSVDNIIKPRIISNKSKIHPIFILLGILGGIITFGISGVIIGPLIIVITLTIIEIMIEEYINT